MLTYNKIKWGSYTLINTKKNKIVNTTPCVGSQIDF
jgi:hypothetical protein